MFGIFGIVTTKKYNFNSQQVVNLVMQEKQAKKITNKQHVQQNPRQELMRQMKLCFVER